MSAAVIGRCFRCGGPVAAEQSMCPYCGMPAIPIPGAVGPSPSAGPPSVLPAAVPPSAVVPTYFGGPALITGPAPRRRPGRRAVAAACLVVLMLIGGGAAIAARLRQPASTSAVRDFFAALSAGQGTRAMGYVLSGAQFPIGRFPLLSSAALADAAHRPADIHIGAPTALAGEWRGLDASSMTVRYRAAGQTVSQPVVVVHTGQRYLVDSPFVELAVRDAAGRAVTVNGVGLGPNLDTFAFPGAYDVAAAGNALLAGARASGVPGPGPQGPAAAVDLGAPTLAGGALAKIQQEARAGLDSCAAGTQAAVPGCPFGLNVPGTAATVHWSITTYPAISATVAQDNIGDVGVAVGDDHTGRVHWDIDYTGYAGDNRHETGDLAFTVNGSAQLTGSGIQVSLAG
jgi:hypothetical protein